MNYGKIITFCLSDEQNSKVESVLSKKGNKLIRTDVYTDIVSQVCSAAVINADALTDEEFEFLISYYNEVVSSLFETVFWLGEPKPDKPLRKLIKCYDSFEQFEYNMKYHFLNAQRKHKRTKIFSERIADSIRILAEIRKQPGIKTKELAHKIERSDRTVQRYLADLQVAEIFLEYDRVNKGWYLFDGVSDLFGDVCDND